MSGDSSEITTRSSGRIPNLKSRGRINRHKLLQAARKHLGRRDKKPIKFNDIFESAGISRGSAYRIYDGIEDLLQDLTGEWIRELTVRIKAVDAKGQPASWKALTDSIVANAAASWLKSGQELIELPRYQVVEPHDYKIAIRGLLSSYADLYNKFFEMPHVPGWLSLLGIAAQLSDTILANEIRREGTISEQSVEHAQQVSRAYLALHLPESLPRRS